MRNISYLIVLLCTLPTHQLERLGIDPVLSASWETVSLQLEEVSQNGHFSQAVWKQKLCDLVSLSDTLTEERIGVYQIHLKKFKRLSS